MRLPVSCLLVLALVLAPGIARTAEDAGDGTAQAPSPEAPASEAQAPLVDLLRPPDCPSIGRCCVRNTDPCVHPGLGRALLAGVTAGFTLGGFMGFEAGDSLGPMHPWAQMMGVGGIGLLGAGIGTILGLFSPRGEVAVKDRIARPTVRFVLTPGGSSVLGEAAPYGLAIDVSPVLDLTDVFTIQPQASVSFHLGTSTDVDPRPQLEGQGTDPTTTFPVAKTSDSLKVSAGAEFSWKLPYPAPGLAAPAYAGLVEFRYKPNVTVRRRTLHAGTGAEQTQELTTLNPMLFGVRWHVSPRQRFTFYVGPRWTWIAFTDPGDDVLRRGPPQNGGLYAEGWYQIDVPFTPDGNSKTSVAGRLSLGYVHDKLNGMAFDTGAVIGFFGPINVSWDFRFRRASAPVAVQIGAGVWLSAGGGPYVEFGLVAPDIRAPRRMEASDDS